MRFFHNRDRARAALLAIVLSFWLGATCAVLAAADPTRNPVTIMHWANGHPAGDEALLPAFMRRFNDAAYTTRRGHPIQVEVRLVNSGVIERELVSRAEGKGPVRRELPDPTIVTPVTRHSLYRINSRLGKPVVETDSARSLATTWIGIATFKDMAQCLGWPDTPIGYEDIIALAEHPDGWASKPCWNLDWGRDPLIAFTDPSSSSTGRSVLFTLYAIAAGKSPEQLTQADAANPAVRAQLQRFQKEVHHYVPDSLLLNCEIFGGPSYGHFFPIAEDNLVKLYRGKVVRTDPELEHLFPCQRATGAPIQRDMVMIYPKEGSSEHTHPAARVQASWVSREQLEASNVWIDFLHQERQQRDFLNAGFRPTAGGLSVQCPICQQNGVTGTPPTKQVNPDPMPPAVGDAILQDWGDIRKPAVGVLVLDNSLAMAAPQMLERVSEAVRKALGEMYPKNSIGLVTYAGAVLARVEPRPLVENKDALDRQIRTMTVESGGSALFDAVAEAIAMVERTPAAERSTRAVIVIAGGPASGGAPLHELMEMTARGKPIAHCTGFGGDSLCRDEAGELHELREVAALRRPGETRVYFISLGEQPEARDTGKLLTDRFAGGFVSATLDDLAAVVGVLKGYF